MADKPPAEPGPRFIPVEWKGVAIALVKSHGLHEGIWRVRLHFAPIHAVNIKSDLGPMPAAMVGVQGIELVEDVVVGPFSVDAAIVNPEHRILVPAGGFH